MNKLKEAWDQAKKDADSALASGDLDAIKGAKDKLLGLKAAIENSNAIDEVSAWAKAPDGMTAAKMGWSRESMEAEGTIAPGIREDVRGGRMTGELYPTDTLSAQKLAVLKSGAYKDWVVDQIRGGLKMPARYDSYKAAGMKVMEEGLDDAGGIWIPPDLKPEVVKKSATITGFADQVYSYPTGSNLVSWPRQVYTTDDKYTSGIRFTPQAEAPSSEYSETTNPVAGRVNIPIITYIAPIIVTREMVEDSTFDLLSYLSGELGTALKLGKNNYFLNGTGGGQALGLLVDPAAAIASGTVTNGVQGMYVASGVSATITWAGSATITSVDATKGVLGLDTALPPQYEGTSSLLMSKKAKTIIGALADTTGRALWLRENQFSNWMNGTRNPPNFLGYNVVLDQFMPDAATANLLPVALGDYTGYHAPERIGMSIQVLQEARAMKGELILLARVRFGGQLVRPWQIKLLKLAAS